MEDYFGEEIDPSIYGVVYCLEEARKSMFMRDEELYVVRSTGQRPRLSVAELLACSCPVRLIYFRYRPDCQISAVSCPQNLTQQVILPMPLAKYFGSWLDGERSDRNRVKRTRRSDLETRIPLDNTVCLCRQMLGADTRTHRSLRGHAIECGRIVGKIFPSGYWTPY